MARRYLGEDGLMRTLEASRRCLDNLKGIATASQVSDALRCVDAIADAFAWKDIAILTCRQTNEAAEIRVLNATGKLASLDQADPVAPHALSNWIAGDAVASLGDMVKIGTASQPVLPGLGQICVYGSCLKDRGTKLEHCFLIGNKSGDLPDKGTRQDHVALVRLMLLALVDGQLSAVEAEGHGPLSPGETEVLTAYAGGTSPGAIAQARNTSVRTVRNQLESARNRLGAGSNAHAVAIATAEGMIPLPLRR